MPDKERLLWDAFTSAESAAARERLFRNYMPLARRLASRFFRNDVPNPVEYDELFQLACTGLLEAIDRYRPELGVPFRYFASRRINGSILNGIARHSEVNQQISMRKRMARERLASLKPAAPASGSVADALDALGEIAAGLALGLMLEDSRLYSVDDRDPARDAFDTLAWKQVVKLVEGEVANLTDRDREIVRMHYLEGIGFDQIGAVLGLTKGRISQIHKAAIALLRKRLLRTHAFRLEG